MLKKVAALLILVCMIVAAVPMSVSAEDDKMTKQEALDKLRDLNNRLIQINKEIAGIKDDKAKAQEKAATNSERKAILEEEIFILESVIDDTRTKLAVKQEELDQKIRDRNSTIELFKERMRVSYMTKDTSLLEAVVGATSFTEFLTMSEYSARVAKHDTDLIDKLEREEKEIEQAKIEIEDALAELEIREQELATKISELAIVIQEANDQITYAEAMEEQKLSEQDDILKARAEAEAILDGYMGTGNGEYIGVGSYIWPVPNYSYISSGFGWRTLYGVPNYHRGIDIAGGGIYGKPVVAADSGYVSVVRYTNVGYGYYVMIDHGANNWTVYAHLSSIAVTEGNFINQGSVLGYVGSTGNSTGPHLHFEIRVDGVQVDPAGFYSYYG